MKRTDLLSKLAEALQESSVTICESTRLASLVMWDSMKQLEVVTILDSALGVQAPMGALAHCRTVGDLVSIASHKLN